MCNYSDAILQIGLDKGRAEGRIEGRAEGCMEGKVDTLVELVKEGVISLKEGARRADLPVDIFKVKAGIGEIS